MIAGLVLALMLIVLGRAVYWEYWGWRAPAIAVALEWSRMDPIPKQATNVEVQTTGNMFTRRFTVSFVLPPDEVDAWLSRSAGIADAQQTTDDEWVCYQIRPGGGAQFAEVRVHSKSGRVRIWTAWS